MAEFTHLHLHTQYSLLDGAIRVKDLFPKVARAAAWTRSRSPTTATCSARSTSTQKAKDARREADLRLRDLRRATDRHDRPNRRNYHLILLAKNEVGYKNLSYLNSMGYLEGFYYNPRIDKQLLREHSEGLIGLSACLGGEIAQTLEKNGVAAAEEVAQEYARHLRAGRLLPRAEPNGLDEQEHVNGELVRMAQEARHPARRDQRLPLRQPRATRTRTTS